MDLGMAFSNGHADMWFWDQSAMGANDTYTADDMYIDTSHYHDDTNKTVTVGVSHGSVGYGGTKGYYLQFTRERANNDALQDVQFADGAFIPYAVAYWNNSGYLYHFSGFDKAFVVGDHIIQDTVTQNYIVTETVDNPITVDKPTTIVTTTTVTQEPSQTTSAFTAILVIATIVAIPVVFRSRRK